MDPSAGYRIPTRAVDAEIEIEGGRLEEVTFFLAATAETHEGPETMGEALNRRRKFFPFERAPAGPSCSCDEARSSPCAWEGRRDPISFRASRD